MGRFSLFVVAVVALMAGGAHAATFTFTGAESRDFHVPGNWSPAGVPGSADAALVEGRECEISMNTTVGTLQVTGQGVVTIRAGITFACVNLSLNHGAIQGPGILAVPAAAPVIESATPPASPAQMEEELARCRAEKAKWMEEKQRQAVEAVKARNDLEKSAAENAELRRDVERQRAELAALREKMKARDASELSHRPTGSPRPGDSAEDSVEEDDGSGRHL